jgi:very-short-patch-repair endonuclease
MDAPAQTREMAKSLRSWTSLPEGLLWRALRGRRLEGLKFRRQHAMGPYVLDFYCAAVRLCVEIDGGSHGFGDRPRRDDERDRWLEAKGVRTLRISAALVLNDVDDAVRTILGALEDMRSEVRGPAVVEDPLRLGAARRATSPAAREARWWRIQEKAPEVSRRGSVLCAWSKP